MDNIFVIGCVISVVFFLVKFLEMRFSTERTKTIEIYYARLARRLCKLHYRLLFIGTIST